jgi:two-component sensor histidine kinase
MAANDNDSAALSALERDELRHRLRNHLQNMTSLINLQIRRAHHPEAVRALEDLRARFGAIVSIYVDLDDPDGEPVAMDAFLAQFVRGITDLYDPMGRHTMAVDIAPIELSGQRAVLLGQIIVELVINVYRHGLADRAGGRASVTLTTRDGEALLTVSDDGPALAGLPEPYFGFRMIASLTRSLGGTFTQESRGGFIASVRFPLADPARTAG